MNYLLITKAQAHKLVLKGYKYYGTRINDATHTWVSIEDKSLIDCFDGEIANQEEYTLIDIELLPTINTLAKLGHIDAILELIKN